MNEFLVLSLLFMLFSISVPICSFSILSFCFLHDLDVLTYICVLFDVPVCFCVNLICLGKMAAFVATLSIPSKRELPATQPNASPKTPALERAKKSVCSACHSLEAPLQVRASLRDQSQFFLSLMLFTSSLVHILYFFSCLQGTKMWQNSSDPAQMTFWIFFNKNNYYHL